MPLMTPIESYYFRKEAEIVDVVFKLMRDMARLHSMGLCHGELKYNQILMYKGEPYWTDYGTLHRNIHLPNEKYIYRFANLSLFPPEILQELTLKPKAKERVLDFKQTFNHPEEITYLDILRLKLDLGDMEGPGADEPTCLPGPLLDDPSKMEVYFFGRFLQTLFCNHQEFRLTGLHAIKDECLKPVESRPNAKDLLQQFMSLRDSSPLFFNSWYTLSCPRPTGLCPLIQKFDFSERQCLLYNRFYRAIRAMQIKRLISSHILYVTALTFVYIGLMQSEDAVFLSNMMINCLYTAVNVNNVYHMTGLLAEYGKTEHYTMKEMRACLDLTLSSPFRYLFMIESPEILARQADLDVEAVILRTLLRMNSPKFVLAHPWEILQEVTQSPRSLDLQKFAYQPAKKLKRLVS